MSEWTPGQSQALYQVTDWGAGFFSVNEEGNVCIHPRGDLE